MKPRRPRRAAFVALFAIGACEAGRAPCDFGRCANEKSRPAGRGDADHGEARPSDGAPDASPADEGAAASERDSATWDRDARVPDLGAEVLDSAAPSGDGGSRAPRILTLSTNVSTLSEDQTLVVSAVVTDPDGVDDLIGGTLTDPASGASYGAFATAAAEGAYEVRLGWRDLNTVRAIDAGPLGVARELRARFFDVSGNASEQDVVVLLRCGEPSNTACEGACVDLLSDAQHCGACGRAVSAVQICSAGRPACPSRADTACYALCVNLETSTQHCGTCGRACPSWPGESVTCQSGGRCVVTAAGATDRVRCQELCALHGYACWSVYWYYGSGFTSLEGTCSAVPPATHPGSGAPYHSMTCTCEAS